MRLIKCPEEYGSPFRDDSNGYYMIIGRVCDELTNQYFYINENYDEVRKDTIGGLNVYYL